MYAKRCAAFILFIVIVGLADATENYMDYGGKLSRYSYVKNYLFVYIENMLKTHAL